MEEEDSSDECTAVEDDAIPIHGAEMHYRGRRGCGGDIERVLSSFAPLWGRFQAVGPVGGKSLENLYAEDQAMHYAVLGLSPFVVWIHLGQV